MAKKKEQVNPGKPSKRAGPWSYDDRKFIEENAEILHYEDIATRLGRNPDAVRDYIENKLKKRVGSSSRTEAVRTVEYKIRRSLIWKELEKQFSQDELSYFVYEWERVVAQFREDILPTEESQVIDYIRFSILMNRILTQQQQNKLELEQLETELLDLRQKDNKETEDLRRIETLGAQIAMRRAAQENLSKEYLDVSTKKAQILKDMKATRDKRVQNLESSKESYIHFMRKIAVDPNIRHQLGLEMEKLRLAMKKEEERLSQAHTYIDGRNDKPILNYKTIMEEEKDVNDNWDYGTNRELPSRIIPTTDESSGLGEEEQQFKPPKDNSSIKPPKYYSSGE